MDRDQRCVLNTTALFAGASGLGLAAGALVGYLGGGTLVTVAAGLLVIAFVFGVAAVSEGE